MSSGYVFSDASSTGDPNIIHNHHINFHEPNPEIYTLGTSNSTSAMENIINGFHIPSKNLDTTPREYPSTPWNHHLLHQGNDQNQISPTQDGRLSLSLTSSKPSNIDHHGLHSFDLTENDDSRFGPSSSRSVNIQENLHIRSSRYLGPAQELLNEFCNLGVTQTHKITSRTTNMDDEEALKMQALYALDLPQLQKRKTKLLQMLLEVERRYKHYCDQMKAVVQLFEAVAGDGAARVYSSMASKAMSRHFRCLKDGILSQIKATKIAVGEKINGGAVAGSSKGETPRLRVLDQTLRQQRALQQMNMMETHPWRPQRGLPERAVSVLRAWLFEHFLNPYPSDVDKHVLARQTGLSRGQVSNWFINARVRLWKPMVEEMYLQDLKESDHGGAGAPDPNAPDYPNNQNEDQKPAINDHLMMRTDSDCLSTIINGDGKQRVKALVGDEGFGAVGNGNEYGSMQFDFSSSSYGHHATATGGGGGGGVSLTLGLHRNGGSGGVSLAFSPASQSSLFYPREQLGECQTVQFSGLDSENHSCFMI